MKLVEKIKESYFRKSTLILIRQIHKLVHCYDNFSELSYTVDGDGNCGYFIVKDYGFTKIEAGVLSCDKVDTYVSISPEEVVGDTIEELIIAVSRASELYLKALLAEELILKCMKKGIEIKSVDDFDSIKSLPNELLGMSKSIYDHDNLISIYSRVKEDRNGISHSLRKPSALVKDIIELTFELGSKLEEGGFLKAICVDIYYDFEISGFGSEVRDYIRRLLQLIDHNKANSVLLINEKEANDKTKEYIKKQEISLEIFSCIYCEVRSYIVINNDNDTGYCPYCNFDLQSIPVFN